MMRFIRRAGFAIGFVCSLGVIGLLAIIIAVRDLGVAIKNKLSRA